MQIESCKRDKQHLLLLVYSISVFLFDFLKLLSNKGQHLDSCCNKREIQVKGLDSVSAENVYHYKQAVKELSLNLSNNKVCIHVLWNYKTAIWQLLKGMERPWESSRNSMQTLFLCFFN